MDFNYLTKGFTKLFTSRLLGHSSKAGLTPKSSDTPRLSTIVPPIPNIAEASRQGNLSQDLSQNMSQDQSQNLSQNESIAWATSLCGILHEGLYGTE